MKAIVTTLLLAGTLHTLNAHEYYGPYRPDNDAHHTSTQRGLRPFWFAADQYSKWSTEVGDKDGVLAEFWASGRENIVVEHPSFLLSTSNDWYPSDIGNIRLGLKVQHGQVFRPLRNGSDPIIEEIGSGLVRITFNEITFQKQIKRYCLIGELGASYLPGDTVQVDMQRRDWGELRYQKSGELTRAGWFWGIDGIQCSGLVTVAPGHPATIASVTPTIVTPAIVRSTLRVTRVENLGYGAGARKKVRFWVTGKGYHHIEINADGDLADWSTFTESFPTFPDGETIEVEGDFGEMAFFRLVRD